jgi:hypothetical protein
LIPQPKWFKTSGTVNLGNLVLFTQTEGNVDEWHLGEVVSIVRKPSPVHAVVQYRNALVPTRLESTTRNIHELVVIHSIHDLDFNTVLHQESLHPELSSAKHLGKSDKEQSGQIPA